MDHIILRDTREKQGWDFEPFEKCKAQVDIGLKTGDYTLSGLETSLCIERKASTGELSLNLGKKRKTFEAERERMTSFRWPYIICEFSLDDLMMFPKNSGIPRPKWKFLRMNGKFMWKKLSEYADEHGINVLFCNNREESQERVMRIFDEITEILAREQAE